MSNIANISKYIMQWIEVQGQNSEGRLMIIYQQSGLFCLSKHPSKDGGTGGYEENESFSVSGEVTARRWQWAEANRGQMVHSE